LSIGLLVLAFTTGGRSSENQLEHSAHHSKPSEVLQPATGAPAPLEGEAEEDISLIPLGPAVDGIVTHYGAQYNGRPLGCGTGLYASENATILAVGPARDKEWSCGTLISVCGAAGCILTIRHDSCPGCGRNHVDLSEAGIALVCGDAAARCRVQLQRVLVEVTPRQSLETAGHAAPAKPDHRGGWGD